MNRQRVVLTPGGVERLDRRIAGARAAFKAVCDDNPAAADAGDNCVWHDNFAYEENQRKMQMLAKLVRDLEVTRASASIHTLRGSFGNVQPERVAIGTRVEYRFSDGSAPRLCWIAGFGDGDPDTGRLSYDSPLGRALVGAEEGEVRQVAVADTVPRDVEILSISFVNQEADR